MILDGRLCNEQSAGDVTVRASFGDQGGHFLLARCQLSKNGRAAARRERERRVAAVDLDSIAAAYYSCEFDQRLP